MSRAEKVMSRPLDDSRLIRVAPPAIAALIALASLVGLLDARTYARETPGWAAQGIGQDWFDLLVLAPALIAAWVWMRRDRRHGGLILAGALACAVYTFAIYTFSVHFNALFLVYCAVFGLSFFALVAIVGERTAADGDRSVARERGAGAFLIGVGVVFGLLWLAEIVPALASGVPPASLVAAGLATNPVHVLDLSIVLPSFVAAGVALVRARPIGRVLAPILASFGVLMALSIAALMIALRVLGEPAQLGVAAAMIAMAIASAVVLVHLLRADDAPRSASA
jgi:hypothetical protein